MPPLRDTSDVTHSEGGSDLSIKFDETRKCTNSTAFTHVLPKIKKKLHAELHLVLYTTDFVVQ